RWFSLSSERSARVYVVHNTRSQQFRVTAHLENERVLDTQLYLGMLYECATATFHQLLDVHSQMYGLKFAPPNADQARQFERTVRQALDYIMRSQEPVMHSNGGSHEAPLSVQPSWPRHSNSRCDGSRKGRATREEEEEASMHSLRFMPRGRPLRSRATLLDCPRPPVTPEEEGSHPDHHYHHMSKMRRRLRRPQPHSARGSRVRDCRVIHWRRRSDVARSRSTHRRVRDLAVLRTPSRARTARCPGNRPPFAPATLPAALLTPSARLGGHFAAVAAAAPPSSPTTTSSTPTVTPAPGSPIAAAAASRSSLPVVHVSLPVVTNTNSVESLPDWFSMMAGESKENLSTVEEEEQSTVDEEQEEEQDGDAKSAEDSGELVVQQTDSHHYHQQQHVQQAVDDSAGGCIIGSTNGLAAGGGSAAYSASSNGAGAGLSLEQFDRLKNEILGEIRTQMDKMKREIIEAIVANR
ncbi:hypothetical protein PRIPAC_74980, partial [Pristionchus pacificus]|uniref:WH1 domain-containing protein n=1 Tax=Pristionchus pacificus TaxID=54126 RepID=A0A2A6C0K7_PRIPA